ncbi:MAG: hypothetical protein A2Y77_04790 [Planctomycetes bacterium RBG_13_62_9]|nr:MAG: hypothetical protein A2Y77_04790 [Planctomycetes bacterium RBG_13_62_9]
MQKRRKSRRKKLLIWLCVDVFVAAVVIALLLHKPSRYNPVVPADPDPNSETVHPYLHRELWSKFYNGAQRQRPFEMVVLDDALNQAIGLLKWPQESSGVRLSAPEVLFTPGHLVLMGTATIEGADFVVTVEFAPQLNEQGDLNLAVEKVKVGAMNITPLARMMAKKMYRERLETMSVNTKDIRAKIAASIFNEEPFEPVFLVEDKWVRLKSFEITQGRLTAQFVPAPRSP